MSVSVQEHDPKPLSADERRLLTWEDATERFIDAAEIRPEEWPSRVGEFWNRLSWPIINAGEVSFSLVPVSHAGVGVKIVCMTVEGIGVLD